MNKSVNRRKFLTTLGISAAGIQTLGIRYNSGSDAIPLSHNGNQVNEVISKDLVLYSVPEGEEFSTDYTVEINRNQVGVQTARVNEPPNDKLDYGGKYSFINFDFRGRIHIRIFSKRTIEMLQIRPLSMHIQKRVININIVELTIDQPCFLSFEPEGKRHPLLIFANPMELNPPVKNDPDVIYFGPGIHKPEGSVIKLKSNQTLYLAGGAIVQAAINVADAQNVTIRGRGIVDATPWAHSKGPQHFFIDIIKSKNIIVEGVIIRGSYSWALVVQGCENVTVENIKICGGRVKNDDGIDLVNTRHISIKNSFIRSDDDCIALKGLRNEWGDVDDVLVEDMVLWNDRSMIARFGVESRTANMQNLVFRNIDIIHYGRQAFNFEPLDETYIQNALFEDIRIEGDGQKLLIAIMPVIHPYYPNRIPGHIRNIQFRRIKLTGAWGDYGYPNMSDRTLPEYSPQSHPYSIEVGFKDDKHFCEGIIFEDFIILGDKLTRATPRLIINDGSIVSVK